MLIKSKFPVWDILPQNGCKVSDFLLTIQKNSQLFFLLALSWTFFLRNIPFLDVFQPFSSRLNPLKHSVVSPSPFMLGTLNTSVL